MTLHRRSGQRAESDAFPLVKKSAPIQHRKVECFGRRVGEIVLPSSSVLWRRDTLGRGVVMRRGEDPSSLCTLMAAIAISMIRFDGTVKDIRYKPPGDTG
jgi:hypothetical protein